MRQQAALYFLLRLSTAGIGYFLSVVGIAMGAPFGRAIAFFDFIRPTSGTIDLFAVRSPSSTQSLAFSIVKFQIYLLCLLLTCWYFGLSFTAALLVIYLAYLWWATYAAVGVIRCGHMQGVPLRALLSLRINRLSLMTVVRYRDFGHLLVTSTFGAISYSAFYIHLSSHSQLLGLRAIDGTLLALSYFAQRIVRGIQLAVWDWLCIAAAVAGGCLVILYLSDAYLVVFCLCRVASMLLCARSMALKKDGHVSVNQTVLASAYWCHHLWATEPQHFLFVLACEVTAILHLGLLRKSNSTKK